MQAFGTISIFVTPVFINNDFWGMAIYEDHHIERYFEDEYTEIMRSAAFLCANTVIRYEMENIIAEESEFNRAIVDALRIGFTVFDENLRVIEVNNASLGLFGCEKQYFLEHFFELSPEYQSDGLKSYDKAFDLLKRALNGENIIFEWTHLTFEGELLPFEITLTRAKYKGKYILLSYQYDLRNIRKITEEMKKQSELLKVRLEQQELITEISSSFVSSGESKKLVDEAIAKLGHYHKVSMVVIFSLDDEKKDTYLAYYWISDNKRLRGAKINLYDLVKSTFPERMYDRATVPVLSCRDTASSNDEAFRVLLDAGVSAFICAPLYVEGRLWGILSVQQSLKPRDWTDNEKGFVAMTASTIAGAIMLDIYNSKLKDAVKKMTAASKAKSEFLSNMSHEMRTPMNAIINMTAIAQNTTDVERKNYALDKIEDASTHLLGVINDILDMSKIEANKFDLVPVEFVFEKMLQRVVNVVNFRVEDKKQKLMVHIDKEIPKTLIGDDQRLSQVITNLLGNAVKFTPENGAIDLYSILLGEKNGVCEIQISVSDTGIGISPEQQARLFQSFQQAESSTVRKFGGTGLGLSISKSIVEMMGGKIWIESELGKGSTFLFTIQAKRGEDKKTGLREKAIALDSVRILAVDDDPDILAFFADVAQRYGLNCDTALSGEAALSLVREKGNYNFYFIDWKMPVMDGIELTSAIKAMEHATDHSVIIMNSAVEWSVIKDKAQEAGTDRFLSKPLFPTTIIDTISECLGVEPNKIEEMQKGGDDFTGHRILLVEDMEINREIVLMLLESTHLDIDCAENGVQAIQMFCEEPGKYEIIFMDVQMPEMDGYEATQRIRAVEKELSSASSASGKHYRKVPIIAMTANVFKEDIDRCINAGMDDHVGKPLDFEVVMEKIRAYLTAGK
jgi:signal transduction histidine kinase/DNA-binding response OmpR family regulator/PAS domain-containing protein